MTLTWILTSAIIIPMGFTIPWTLVKCEEVWWAYIKETKQIYVCDTAEKEVTTYHETAHYFWYNFLTEKEKQLYTKQFNKAKSHFREYSSTSAEEDFADAYATISLGVYLNWNKINKDLRKRQLFAYKIINKYVK